MMKTNAKEFKILQSRRVVFAHRSARLKTKVTHRFFLTVFVAFLLFTPSISVFAQIYVDPCAPGPGDGSAGNPFNTLQSAVSLAKTTPGEDKIIMAGGLYPEALTIDQAAKLMTTNGPAIVGGFAVGWRDVLIQLDSVTTTNARIYYPSSNNGPDLPLANGCGAFPAVVYAHGLRNTAYTLCGWCDGFLQTDCTKDYLQAEGILKNMAASGFIALAFNWNGLTIHYPEIAEYILTAISFLGTEFGDAVDLQRIGLVGHSTGGSAVIKAVNMLKYERNPPGRIRALGLIAPAYPSMLEDQNPAYLSGPVLIIHGTRDHPCQVGVGPLELYCEAASPKHLVIMDGANHFGYTDGLCLDPMQVRIGECRWDAYGLDPRDYMPYSPGHDNDSQVGGLTGQQAHQLQQLAARHYLQAFFSYYLQSNAGSRDYIMQVGGRQCGHVNDSGLCAQDLLIDPLPAGTPVRYFDDLQAQSVNVHVYSCIQ